MNKKYLLTYYLLTIINIILVIIFGKNLIDESISLLPIIILFINSILPIIYTILLLIYRNLDITNKDIIINIISVVYTIIFIILILVMNNYVGTSLVHIPYYYTIYLLTMIIINIYNILNIKIKKVQK